MFFFFSKNIDLRIKIFIYIENITVIVQQKYLNAYIYTFWHFIMQLLTIAICFMLCISPFGFYIFIIFLSLFLFLSRSLSVSEKFQYIFNNAEHAIPRLSLRSILLIFCFKSVFSFSLCFYFSPSLSLFGSPFFHLFTYLLRQGNSSCKHTSSKKPQTTLESHRFVVSTRFFQRKHDIRANKILIFFLLVFTARS